MRRVEGFICIDIELEPRHQAILFGKNIGGGFSTLQNFGSNNLTPFPTLEEGMEGYYNLRKQKEISRSHKVNLANIELKIAQNEDEIELFRNLKKRSWIVLQIVPFFNDVIFYGKPDDNALQVGYIGSLLETNGLKPFRDFNEAYKTAREVNRQAQSPAQIASFLLRPITLGK